MPTFALANTAVCLGGAAAATAKEAAAAAAASAASVTPAAGIALGLLIGKPLGIFGSTWLATRLGVAQMPQGARRKKSARARARASSRRTLRPRVVVVHLPRKKA